VFVSFLLRRLSSDITPLFCEGKCITRRQKNIVCHACEDACPNGAIAACGKEIEPRKCEGCGVCVAACPAGALSPPWRVSSLLRRAAAASPGILGCGKSAGDVTVACLAGLPWEFFASLSLYRSTGKVELDVSPCFTCKNMRVLWVLFRTLKKTRIFLGDEKRISIILSHEPERFQQSSVSRREMFTRLGHASKEWGKESAAEIIAYQDESDVNPYRQQLWQATTADVSARVTWPVWQVSGQCVLCGRCHAVCSQNAWEIKHVDDKAKLLYYPRRCTECSVCEMSCPQSAKRRGRRKVAEKQNPLVQHVQEQQVCSRCRKSHAGKGPLCVSCGRREEIQKELATRLL
jgi:MinD superfamily P-loop ATPase